MSCVVSFVLLSCGGSSSSGSSSSDSETLTISGTVSIPSTQSSSINVLAAFTNSELDGAHVNVCTIQDGTLETLSGQSSVLSDSSGSFSISIDVNDIPSNNQMWVCASSPTSGDYTILAPIPEDSLPSESNEVTTVSVNPNLNTTLITRYACGQNIMLFNANKCLAVDEDQFSILDTALDDYFAGNSGVEPDLSDLDSLLSNIANDSTTQSTFQSWLSEVSGVDYSDFISDAQGLELPSIPEASSADGDESVSVTGLACDLSTSDGITTATISAAGTAGGGDLNVFTVFFTVDGGDLTSPDSLGCGNWQQSGGLGSCTKLSVSADTTSFIGSLEVLRNEGSGPTTIVVQVKGYQSGSSTVLASDTETTTCD